MIYGLFLTSGLWKPWVRRAKDELIEVLLTELELPGTQSSLNSKARVEPTPPMYLYEGPLGFYSMVFGNFARVVRSAWKARAQGLERA